MLQRSSNTAETGLGRANYVLDSDDSDGEGGMGNVNRLIMRPPGHSGKAKRGHLCFDASFETGNLGRVDLVNEYEYDLFIRPDSCSPKLRFWFNFTVDNVKQDQKVIFNIVNISKEKNLFMENMTPLVKSSSRPKWQRIPKQHVFYHKSVVHQGHYVLSFSFGFDKEDDIFHFCLAPPYSYTRLQTFLNILEKKATYLSENFKREHLESSVQNRRLDLITIGSLDRNQPKSKRRVVAIMARVHPGESPSSFVCQGLLELLISSNSIAAALREHIIFKIIPMLNPDGVFLGNYRSTVAGSDLNRSWHIANPWCHPTIKAVIDMLLVLDRNKEFQLDFVLDIHAHSSLKGCFVYGNTYDDVYRYERHILFPKLLATTCDDYIAENTMFNSDNGKIAIKDMRCGRNLVRTFLEYYHNTGAIPFQITSEIANRRHRPRIRQIRRRNRNRYQPRPLTSRTVAQLHFKNLNINYDSDTSLDDFTYSYRNSGPQRTFERISEQLNSRRAAAGVEGEYGKKVYRSGSPLPATFVVLPEPSLSIIDFNLISREDIEKVSNFNKVKVKKS
ncbi:hypothetical protein NQ318_009365 [Aromia moschata]|uniref:Peptidase M14 domain-containing protein n=1 Tax=Aromia moschata TaxID=1265417 RepID=A0AAV8XF80_9CUCU|nr:hypothetical protein NQ318_009365 [Aromia moschata]